MSELNHKELSFEECQEQSRRRHQRNQFLFYAFLGLSGILYLLTLIHL